MRSRILHPRTLFRIAGPAPAAVTTAASTASVAARALPSAPSSSLAAIAPSQHPHLYAAASTSGSSASASSSSPTSSSASAAASSSSSSSSGSRHSRHASTSALSPAPKNGGSSGSGSSSSSSSSSSGSSNGSASRSRSPGSTASSRTPAPTSTTAAPAPAAPILPVRPPPHSRVSVGLQCFFSQGRPLLEHNNMPSLASMGTALPPGMGEPSAFIGLAVPMPVAVDAAAEGEYEAAETDTTEAQGSSPAPSTHLIHHKNVDELPAEIRKLAEAASQRLTEIRDRLTSADPAETLNMLKEMVGGGSGAGEDALAADATSTSTSASALTMQLHLPALRGVPQSSFNKVLSAVATPPTSGHSPLALHASILQAQGYEKERQAAIRAALDRGEDPALAEALGPESEYVVVGEPRGPQPQWGPGVASYLAKHGKAFQPPRAPAPSDAAARVKGLDDLLPFSDGEAALDADADAHADADAPSQILKALESLNRSGHEHGHADDADAALNADSDADAEIDATADVTVNPGGGTNPSEVGDADDVNLWLGHALVQERMKSEVQWDAVRRMMAGAGAAANAVVETLPDLRTLKGFDPDGERLVLLAAAHARRMNRLGRAGRRLSGMKARVGLVRSEREIADVTPRGGGGEGEGEGEITDGGGGGGGAVGETTPQQDVRMDSVRRKRKKKMRKMKYKKLRKRQRTERRRLKKQ